MIEATEDITIVAGGAGLFAPRIYDIDIDEWRSVTQDDTDRWTRQQQIIGQYLRGQDLIRGAYRMAVTGEIEWDAYTEAFAALEKLVNPEWPQSRLVDPKSFIGTR